MDAAEPPWELADQFLLIVTDPRHVAVRPQQHRGDVQFLADIDDVVEPDLPTRRPRAGRSGRAGAPRPSRSSS
jgi:hypothetical protein